MFYSKRLAFSILLLLFLAASHAGWSQTNMDSVNIQKRYNIEMTKRDSILLAAQIQKQKDSIAREVEKQRLQNYRDSLLQVQIERRKQDSIKREEIKAQMLAERQRQDSIRSAQQAEMKRLVAERKRVADSIRSARQLITDSLKLARAEARKIREAQQRYRNSKTYKDSLAQVRQSRRDSLKLAREENLAQLKAERTKRLDSIKAVRVAEINKLKIERKRVLDSTIAARKVYNDSLKLARQTFLDSIKLVREKRKDSLDKIRAKDEKVAAKQKTESEILKEQADKIHARKQGSWTNEQLLKKGWNIKRRIWQNTVTRYNSYYNAKRKYDDALKRLKERNKDVYTEQITIYPYKLESGFSTIGGDMDTVIKKCAFDTQIHDPRSKWFDNVYHLMGRAFFFKNDYESAITAFQYVANEYKDGDFKKRLKKGYQKLPALNEIKFDKDNKVRLATKEKRGGIHVLAHHPIRNEALIWLARSYTMNNQFGEAQSILTILDEDKVFPDRLRANLYLAMAEMHIQQGNQLSAIEPLEKAVKHPSISKNLKNRASYLLAQLHAKNGDIEAANKYLQKGLNAKIPLEMEYYSKLTLAQNSIAGKGNLNTAINQLEELAREEKYRRWRAQTYYSLGKTLQESKPTEAIKNYENCITQEESQTLKAHAYLGLGDIHYRLANYTAAKSAYDSTIAFSKDANPPIENLAQIELRQEVLTSLVMYTEIIQLEDSLQALSKMNKKDQLAVIRKELKRLEKERRKQIQAESAKLTAVALSPTKAGKNSWYFYNNTNIQQGIIDFKTKWGDRQLKDNWRLSSGDNFNSNLLAGEDSTGSDINEIISNNANANKLLEALYKTPEAFESSNDRIIDAYYQLGIIYTSRLKEYQRSIDAFETLNTRFPEHTQLAATYYSMILSYTELNNKIKAEEYRKKLNAKFAQTEFAKIVSGASKQLKLEEQKVTVLYDSAYLMLKRYEFDNALSNATASLNTYPENSLRPKFELVKAKSLAGLKKYDSSIVVIENIIKTYPGTDEEKHAQELLNYLVKLTQLKGGNQSAFNDSMGNQSVTNSKENLAGSSAVYTYNKYQPHFYMIHLNKLDGNVLALKAGFSDYNRLKHTDKNLKTNMNLLDRNSAILSVSEFKNAESAEKYMKQTKSESKLFSSLQGVSYKEMIISAENFKELLKTRKIEEYIQFYKDKY